MSSTKRQRMSTGSSPGDLAVQFTRRDSRYYTVYHAKVNHDLVYQFWPKESSRVLPPDFVHIVERPFIANLHPKSPVEADYHDIAEATILQLMRPDDEEGKLPIQEMLYVKIHEGAMMVGNETILRGKLFEELDHLLYERYKEDTPDLSSQSPKSHVPRSKRAKRLIK